MIGPSFRVFESSNIRLLQPKTAVLERLEEPRFGAVPPVDEVPPRKELRRNEVLPPNVRPLFWIIALAVTDVVRVASRGDGLVGESRFAAFGVGKADVDFGTPGDWGTETGGRKEEGAVEHVGEGESVDKRFAFCKSEM